MALAAGSPVYTLCDDVFMVRPLVTHFTVSCHVTMKIHGV
jgi:hypothetical protein